MLKRIGIGLAVLVLVLGTGLWLVKARADARIFDGYDPTAPLGTVVRSDEAAGDFRRIEFVYEGRVDTNDPLVREVPTILCTPLNDPGPWPAIIFVHGIGQRKEFVEEIAAPFVEAGFAILSFDQYTRGERRLPDEIPEWRRGLALRERAALNVLETRRVIDYLETRDDIAHDRIYLMGASFGAITGSNAAAFDERIAGAVLTYGGGDIPRLVDSDLLREEVGDALMGLIKVVASALFGPLDPVHHIHKISPRPILVQGGTLDTVVPLASTQALYDAATQPKELTLYESDHIGLDPDHVGVVLGDTLEWLRARDAEVLAGTRESREIQAAL